MTAGLRHIGDVLPGALSAVAGGWLARGAQPAGPSSWSVPSSVPSSSTIVPDLDNRNSGRGDAQDVGYFVQELGYFTQGPTAEGPGDVR
ncbi:hypothetical protein HLH33_13030 [Gluconacetobacter diazotrophicus]|uniref:Uncharacterized protein n=1 Tax=Gluconacetobacter diazotrophicus TaxID=33996 RepID=A0A7W4I6L2_GLUDI|nr:hypothetical protein [Gluconacetobacter diazotrophicus]MBB2157223.1 hypothetical protein [Gluconacetobacter diazotrophicus]